MEQLYFESENILLEYNKLDVDVFVSVTIFLALLVQIPSSGFLVRCSRPLAYVDLVELCRMPSPRVVGPNTILVM